MNDYHSNGLSSYEHPGLHEFDVFYLKVLPLKGSGSKSHNVQPRTPALSLQVFDMDLLKECAHTRYGLTGPGLVYNPDDRTWGLQ